MHAQVYEVVSNHMRRVDSHLPLVWQSSGPSQEGHSTYTWTTGPVDWLAGYGEWLKVSTMTLSPRVCRSPSTALFL